MSDVAIRWPCCTTISVQRENKKEIEVEFNTFKVIEWKSETYTVACAAVIWRMRFGRKRQIDVYRESKEVEQGTHTTASFHTVAFQQ